LEVISLNVRLGITNDASGVKYKHIKVEEAVQSVFLGLSATYPRKFLRSMGRSLEGMISSQIWVSTWTKSSIGTVVDFTCLRK
jgi:hypothetical protein